MKPIDFVEFSGIKSIVLYLQQVYPLLQLKKKITKLLLYILQFQGWSVRSQHWFNLDPDFIEDNFMTREPDFSKVYTLNILQAKPKRIGLHLFPIGYTKKTSQVQFDSDTHIKAYQKHNQNSCCMISLAYDFKYSNKLVDENVITT